MRERRKEYVLEFVLQIYLHLLLLSRDIDKDNYLVDVFLAESDILYRAGLSQLLLFDLKGRYLNIRKAVH